MGGPDAPTRVSSRADRRHSGERGHAGYGVRLAIGLQLPVLVRLPPVVLLFPVVAGIVTGERPSAAQAAGIGLAVVGVVLASRARAGDGGHAAKAEGGGLALVAALAFGLLLVALGEASEGDPYWGTFAMRGTSFSLLVLIALVLRPSFALRERDLPVLFLVGVLDTAGNVLFAVATTKSLLALAAVLAQLYPVVTVLLARILLGERISRGQGAGVVSAFSGVALITAG